MHCKAEASGPAYEKYSRIFANFNHLTGEAKVQAANNQVEHGSSMTISVTCTSLNSKSENAVLNFSYDVQMQDECVGAPINVPTQWNDMQHVYLWRDDQVQTLSSELFSNVNKECGELSFEVVGLDKSSFSIKQDDAGVSIISKPASRDQLGVQQFTVKACQGKQTSCVESSPMTMEILDDCKYNEILPFSIPDIDAVFDHA